MIFIKRRGYNPIRHWLWQLDRVLLMMIVAVMALGALLITTASPSVAQRIGLPSFYFVHRHLLFLLLALPVMLLFSYVSEKHLRKICLIGFVSCIAMMFMLPFVGEEIKGATRWLALPGFSLQPSELLKPFMAVVVGMMLAEKANNEKLPVFSMVLILYSLCLLLLMLQPDFGMSVSLTVVTLGQLFMAGLSLFWIVVAGIFNIGAIITAYLFFPHVAKRIDKFLNSEAMENYQVERSLEAHESGGFWGKGPGEGDVKRVLPDAHTDFIFAVAGEELGAFFSVMILILFFAIIVRIASKLYQSLNLFEMYSACGLLLHFAFQVIFNIGVTLHLLPTKGMTLPFVSYGGSSIISFAITMGICLNFTRNRHARRSALHL